MSVRSTLSGREVSDRWPNIGRFLRVDPNGWIDGAFQRWACVEGTLHPAERAAAYEEWADFYEWRLEQRADDMAYCARRNAAYARGADPGEWIPLWERRPDLDAATRAIVAEIIAELAAPSQPAGGQVAPDLRKAG